MSTLLERAKARQMKVAGSRHPMSNEEVELALAWLRGEVTITQVSAALYPDAKAKTAGGTTGYRVACVLRYAYQTGQLRIEGETK